MMGLTSTGDGTKQCPFKTLGQSDVRLNCHPLRRFVMCIFCTDGMSLYPWMVRHPLMLVSWLFWPAFRIEAFVPDAEQQRRSKAIPIPSSRETVCFSRQKPVQSLRCIEAKNHFKGKKRPPSYFQGRNSLKPCISSTKGLVLKVFFSNRGPSTGASKLLSMFLLIANLHQGSTTSHAALKFCHGLITD